MKFKSILGVIAALGITAACTSAIYAADYTVESKVDNGVVTMDVCIAPGTNETSVDVNAYAVKLVFESSVLQPQETGSKDLLGTALYAENAFSTTNTSVFVADNVGSAVTIGWADKDAKKVNTKTKLATVKFKVSDTNNAKDTNVSLNVVALANSDKQLSDENKLNAAQTTIKLTSNVLRGDANGDGVIDISDAGRIAQYVVDSVNTKIDMANSDADKNGIVDIADAGRIALYIVSGEVW